MITADYVNAVFKVLKHLDGDVTRSLVSEGKVTFQDDVILRAIYNDPLYQEEVNIASETTQEDRSIFRQPAGDIRTVVLQLIDSSPTCIFVETRSTYDAVVVHPTAPVGSEYWRLSLKQAGADPESLNPTPWAMSFNAKYKTPTTIPDQCSAG